jgi:general L-amino acid transport system substrate-binding protein
LGKSEDTGKLLGLDREWLARAVMAVGNYGEIFDKHLGEKTPLGLKRGLNAQWNQGGLQYAIPIR